MVGVLLKVRIACVSSPVYNTHHATGDETKVALTFYKTPTMLLGMKHKEFLALIKHPPCYWG
jgi:hypothetical protein